MTSKGYNISLATDEHGNPPLLSDLFDIPGSSELAQLEPPTRKLLRLGMHTTWAEIKKRRATLLAESDEEYYQEVLKRGFCVSLMKNINE